MTRGKILFIDTDGNLYCSTEFNGDMYPSGRGGEVIERFEEGYFTDFARYFRFVENFNRRNYGYKDNLFEPFDHEDHMISIKTNWTDYLYVINESAEEWSIVDKHDHSFGLSPHTLAIVNFQEVEKMIPCASAKVSDGQDCILSAEEFTAIIDQLRESSDLADKVNALFRNSQRNIEADSGNGTVLQISHESIVVKLLKKLLHDRDNWIEYYIYELAYGRKYEPGMIREKDGKFIDISSALKLYSYLTSN